MKKIYLTLIILTTLTSCIETAAIATIGGVYYANKEKTVSESISDTKLSLRVKKHLLFNSEKNYKEIKVTTYKNRVLLTGAVPKNTNIVKLTKIAWEVAGVKEVINKTTKAERKNAAYDKILLTQIKTKLLLNKEVESNNLEVIVFNKKTYLLGEQKTQKNIEIAAKIAAKVKGVKKVISFIKET